MQSISSVVGNAKSSFIAIGLAAAALAAVGKPTTSGAASTTTPVAPNNCAIACALAGALALAQCGESSLLCGPLAAACFETCSIPVLINTGICIYGCSGGGGGGGYQIKTSDQVYRYHLGELVTIAAGRWDGTSYSPGEGTVAEAKFYIMNVGAVPSGGYPAGTALDSLPWISLGPGVFDGSHLWSVQADMGANTGAEGYIVRIDFEDSSFPDTQLGIGLMILQDAAPVAYCTPAAPGTSNGCIPAITATGQPDAAHSGSCVISISNVEGQKTGIVFYGLTSTTATWCVSGNSFLCVKSPTQRTAVQGSGGTANACDGSLTLDWNAFQSTHPGALGSPWTSGQHAYVQGWFRDPPSCKTTFLSPAIDLTYLP